MKLSYTVSKEEYLSALLFLLRRKSRTPMRIFTTFMLTLGQFMGVLAFCLLDSLDPWKKAVLLILSVIVGFANGLMCLPTPWKARMLLWRTKRNGQWDSEYEKRHNLFWEEDKLVLQYGKVRQKLPAVSVSELPVWKGALLVMTGDVLFCVIPAAVFEGKKAALRDKLIREICDHKFRESREQIREKREELKKKGEIPYRYHYDEKTYLEALREACRRVYLTGLAWRMPEILRLLTVLGLIAVAVGVTTTSWRVLALLATCILLYPYVRVFSPWVCRVLRRDIQDVLSFQPGHEAELYSNEEALVFLGDIHCLVIPWEDVYMVKKLHRSTVLYLKNRMSVPIPRDGSGKMPAFM